MIDNTNKYRNFKETVPKKSGSLPMMPFVNIKDVLLKWLEFRFKQMGLEKPIILLGEYPSQTNLSNIPVGEDGTMITNNLRGVSVVMLDGSAKRQGIGQVLQGEEVPNDMGEPVAIKYGWHERLQVEVTYWSVSSRDRDFGGDLTRAFLHEAFRIGWLMQNGVIEMEMRNYYDTADSRVSALNRMLSYSVTTFEFTRQFFGTLDYSQFKEMQNIEGIEWDAKFGDFQIDTNAPEQGEGFQAAWNYGDMADFSSPEGGIIILPGGTSEPLATYHSSSEPHLGICKGSVI